MKKKNKTLIIIELIVIGMLILLIAYMIITAKNKKAVDIQSESESKTKEEILIDNVKNSFESGVSDAKEGKKVDYIPCSDVGVDCVAIKDFNVLAAELVDETKDGKVFKITYEWSCKDETVCFYNEQYSSDLNINGKFQAYSHYLTDDEGRIKKALGNVYIKDSEIQSANEESEELES